jgi:hypothetical protein
MKKYTYIFIGLILLAGVIWLIITPGKPGKLDDFAKCLKNNGATFYGAFWCSHCQNQKKEFGVSAKYLPYVECSTPDGQGQTQICKDAGVSTYPTWQFGQSTTTRITGEISLEQLASSTSCVLPQ